MEPFGLVGSGSETGFNTFDVKIWMVFRFNDYDIINDNYMFSLEKAQKNMKIFLPIF